MDEERDDVGARAAIGGRRSVRRFLDLPVADDTLRRILELSARAASGGNLQPWQVHVVRGAALKRMSEAVLAVHETGAECPDYRYYPEVWREPYLSRRRKVGFDLYARLGITREDKAGRAEQFRQNFRFFGAPVGIFVVIERDFVPAGFLDSGLFLGNLAIAARSFGLETCLQAAWVYYGAVVRRELGLGDDHLVVAAAALGHADPTAPENEAFTERAPIDEFTVFHES